jgi:hypothetical protein
MLEVKTGKLQFVLIVLLGLFFVPAGFGFLISGVLKGFSIVPIVLGVLMLLLYGVVFWLVLRGYRKSVRQFTNEGLTRNDGRQFQWANLSRVVDKIRLVRGRQSIWRTEIQFKDGDAAWLIPMKVGNYGEVRALVDNLPCEHAEERA